MRSRLQPLAALGLVALIGAGCSKAPARTATSTGASSSSSSNSDSNSSIDPTREQAMKFAECMRNNGVKAFPDPDASGSLTIDAIANGSSVDTSSAAFKQAISVCKGLEPPGFTGRKRSAQQQKAALEFAQCMRDNGVKDFPDPTADAPLIDTNRIPSLAGKDPRGILDAPMRKCRDAAAGAGVTGGQ